MSWCNPAVYPFLLRRCVLVALGRACMCVMLSASYFIGVAVAFKPYFWWCARSLDCGCLAGVGMAFFGCESAACERSYGWVLDISMVSCICAHGLAPQYQSCTLVAHSISSVFLSLPAELHTEKAACMACHKVNKCTSHPKQKTQNGQTTFHFPGGLCGSST